MEVNIYRQVASWRGWGLFDWGVEDGSVFNWGWGIGLVLVRKN